MREVDVVVAGGGPAGLSTALHLQEAAPRLRVLVLEKERYPREKICAGGIGARAFKRLERIGVEVDCPKVPLDALAVRLADDTIVTRVPGLGAVVRRVEFDHALARVAMRRGIEVRDGCAVETIELPDPAGAGDPRVALTTSAGERILTRALVGADGVSGVVRKQTGFPHPALRAQVVELDTEASDRDLPRDTVVFDFVQRDLAGYAWDFPTLVDGVPLVCRGAYVIRNLGKDDARARCAAYLADRGLDIGNYRIKQFAERGWEPGAPIARHRVMLVGEAAGIDIATGEGIGQAIEYGTIAGPYLARALARDDLSFADWQRTVERHHLGFQLRIRHLAYRWFYGEKRATVERAMPRLGAMFKVALQDFAGVPISPLALAHGLGQLARVYVGAKLA